MMDRKVMMILSLFALFLFMGSLVLAEEGSGTNAGSVDSPDAIEKKAMMDKDNLKKIKIEDRMRFDDSEREKLRVRFGNVNVSDDDLRRLQIARINASDLEKLDVSARTRLLSELRIRIKSDDVTRFREVEVRLKERDTRVEAIRDARSIADARLSAIARLKLLESELDGEALTRVAAIRAKLEASSSTTVATIDASKIEDEIRMRHRENASERGESAVAKAEEILTKLQSFTDRIEAKLADSDAPRPRVQNVVDRLNGIEADLIAHIASTKVAWSVAQEDDATREEIKMLHEELVHLRIHAKQAVSAMHALIRAIKDRDEGSDDIRAVDETSIVSDIEASDAMMDAEVMASVEETTPSSDDSMMESDDSGMDSDSDTDDSDEDDSSETDDSGMDSDSDADDSDEDNGGDDQ